MLNQALSRINTKLLSNQSNKVQREIEKLSLHSTDTLIASYKKKIKSVTNLVAILSVLSQRILGITPYYHQIQGVIGVLQGKSLNMHTGEGKTLVCTIGAAAQLKYHNTVKVCTSNEYLSFRDYSFSKPFFDALGISNSNDPRQKVQILYSPIQSLIVAWLQDASAMTLSEMTHTNFNSAHEKHSIIIDEIDSTLIDSSSINYTTASKKNTDHTNTKLAFQLSQQIKKMHPEIIIKGHEGVDLSHDHFEKFEHCLKKLNISANLKDDNSLLYFQIKASLMATCSLTKGVDYTVIKGEIFKLNQESGRADKRTFNDLVLHALQIKEGVRLTGKNRKIAISSLQNYVRRYDSIIGMSGTASMNALELKHTYGISVISIPRRMNNQLTKYGYSLHASTESKLNEAAILITKAAELGNPVLVITPNEEEVFTLNKLLNTNNIPLQILTSQNINDEEAIIKNAGSSATITLTTRICSRGADIIVKDEKEELVVVSTSAGDTTIEDHQLSGRTARQGKRGSCHFLCSIHDDFFSRITKKKGASLLRLCKNSVEPNDKREEMTKQRTVNWLIKNEQKINLALKRNKRKQLMYFDEPISSHLDILLAKRTQILQEDTPNQFLAEEFAKLGVNINYSHAVAISREVALDSLDATWIPHINSLIENRSELFQLGADGIRKYKSNAAQLLDEFVSNYQNTLSSNIKKTASLLV